MKEILEFCSGHVYKGPEEIEGGKFVRIGKLLVVSPDPMDDHWRLICPQGLGAGDKNKFEDAIERLREAGSFRADAGYIYISTKNKLIILHDNSWSLNLPANEKAREATTDFFRKCHPDFNVINEGTE